MYSAGLSLSDMRDPIPIPNVWKPDFLMRIRSFTTFREKETNLFHTTQYQHPTAIKPEDTALHNNLQRTFEFKGDHPPSRIQFNLGWRLVEHIRHPRRPETNRGVLRKASLICRTTSKPIVESKHHWRAYLPSPPAPDPRLSQMRESQCRQ